MLKRTLTVSLITATLGLGVAGAQATTTPAPVLTDVPAGHWAQDAVRFLVERGIIQGFPDNTFRGNQPLTRYQAAEIFYRLLRDGGLGGLTDEELVVVVRGIQDVADELAALALRVNEVAETNVAQARQIEVLEARVAQLVGAAQADPSMETVQQLQAAVQELQQAVQTLAQRVPAAGAPSNADLAARITALQEQLTELQASVQTLQQAARTQPAPQDTGDLAAQLAQLREQVAALTATVTEQREQIVVLQQRVPAAGAPSNADLVARITALEAELTRLRQAQAAPPVTPATPTPPAPTPPAPVVVTPTTPTTVVVAPGAPGVTAQPNRGAYAGVYAQTPLTEFSTTNLAFGALFGTERLLGRFGARTAVHFRPTTNALDGSASLTYSLGRGFLEPYLGAGAGVVWSPDRLNANVNALDFYAQGLVGTNFNFTSSIAAFAELTPKFFFSNQGVAVPAGTNGGFAIGTKFGLKFYF